MKKKSQNIFKIWKFDGQKCRNPIASYEKKIVKILRKLSMGFFLMKKKIV